MTHDPSVTPIDITVAIPTFGRDRVLIETVEYVLAQRPPASEVMIIDQSVAHAPDTERALREWHEAGRVRWIRLPRPSIPGAMNVALRDAGHPAVLFLDDDVVPCAGLVAAHGRAQRKGHRVVVGQVLQPGEEPLDVPNDGTCFNSSRPGSIEEIMAGNLSVDRQVALQVGGFDENFVGAAYRFESDFAERLLEAGHSIDFVPAAGLRHLRIATGGTRSFGDHLKFGPGHAVGEYYYLLRSRRVSSRAFRVVRRLAGAVSTRFHLRHPWWIPSTLLGELIGLVWALGLAVKGPKLMTSP